MLRIEYGSVLCSDSVSVQAGAFAGIAFDRRAKSKMSTLDRQAALSACGAGGFFAFSPRA